MPRKLKPLSPFYTAPAPDQRFAINATPVLSATQRHLRKTVLWLLGAGDNQKRREYIVRKASAVDRQFASSIRFVELTTDQWHPIKPGTKGVHVLTAHFKEKLNAQIAFILPLSSVVVINHFAALDAILADSTGTGNKNTLASFRGSVYSSALLSHLPTVVCDAVEKCYTPAWKQEIRTGADPQATEQLFEFDLQKAYRFWSGTEHEETSFRHAVVVGQRHTGAATMGEDAVLASLPDAPCAYVTSRTFLAALSFASACSIDFETSMGGITCIGVSLIWNNDPRTIVSFVLPYNDTAPTAHNGEWMTRDTFFALLRAVSASPIPKFYANGSYDAHYHVKFGAPPVGQIEDVIHMWHSYRHRMPKSLATIASIFSDSYYYWKDEIKGGSTEKKTQVAYAVPVTPEGLHVYWRYCALDCHHTLLRGLQMAHVLSARDNTWALNNYNREMALQYGPIFKASYMGCRLDQQRLRALVAGASDDAATGLTDLITASNGIVTEGTDAQVIEWLYHTLGARPPKQRKDRESPYSVDQKQLQLVAEQHPIFASAIHYLRSYRKPAKQDSMYGELKHQWGRFQYKYSVAGTYTGRLSGKASDFWVGTNPQNIPASMRSFIRADKGKVMFDIDYSQADLYHFAVAVGDKNMINNVFDDRDTHAVHVEMILKRDYADVVRGKKAGEPWVTDPITGCRQIIKKLSHGGNYGMMGNTAYLNAGRGALDAAAEAVGINTAGWTIDNYYALIDRLLVPYFKAYPGQMEFRREVVAKCIANKGLASCLGGHTVYFHEWQRPRDKDSLMRALLAFHGQGGTAAMINEAILRMHYRNSSDHVALPADARSFLDFYGIDLLLQTHDSITYQMDWEVLSKEPAILKLLLHYMEIECNFNNVTYRVPCEVQIGSRWSKKMPEVKNTASSQDLILAALDHFRYENDILNP